MKKVLLTIVAIAMATTMNAQWYVGGSVGFASVKVGGGNSETVYKILPEVGYALNKNWSFGVALGYQKGAYVAGTSFTQVVMANQGGALNTAEVFSVSPYARYTFLKGKLVDIFCDAGLDFASIKDGGTLFGFGARPGLAVKATEKLSFVTHVGFLGFNSFSPKGGGDSSSEFGLDLSGTNITFGLYYNF